MTDEEIKSLVDDIQQEICKEESEHVNRIKSLRQKLLEIQKQCPHNSTRFEPDASGNNDSAYECLTCGKIAKRLKRIVKQQLEIE